MSENKTLTEYEKLQLKLREHSLRTWKHRVKSGRVPFTRLEDVITKLQQCYDDLATLTYENFPAIPLSIILVHIYDAKEFLKSGLQALKQLEE